MLEVLVETPKVTAARDEFEGEDDLAGRWLAAQEATTESQTYPFQVLDLYTESGQLKPVGESLRLVLRLRGKRLEALSVEKLVALNHYLSDIFQIPDDPIEYDSRSKRWRCRFEAASAVVPPR